MIDPDSQANKNTAALNSANAARAVRGEQLLAATLRGNLWQRWRAHMRMTDPWTALKLAWRHK
jgi:hypothetical protein